jgi:soluble lytic murein transglycosylase
MFHCRLMMLTASIWLFLAVFVGGALNIEARASETVPVSPQSVSLPKPLSSADADRYRKIFDLQQEKKWKEADKLINALEDDLLLGRVLSQRYLHPTGWRSTYKELREWLDKYNDHPAASRISWLAKKRRPANAKPPKYPKPGYLNGYGRTSMGRHYISIPATTTGRASPAKTRSIAKDVRRRIRSGWPSGASDLLTKENLRYLTKFEEAVLRADIAHGYFIYGKDLKAISYAKQAIALGGVSVHQAYWTAGIAAWRHGDIDLAMNFLRTLADQEDAPEALVSSAAFWASRATLRKGEVQESFRFLDIAARHQDTFYGTLAAEALGQDIRLDFTLPAIDPVFITRLSDQPGGRRALALLQVGETYHASRELRYLWKEMNWEQRHQVMALAAHTHMAGLSFRAADIFRREISETWYGALYPVPDFETSAPIRVDQALLLAIMRQESGFNPRAKSWAKASGLMQLMPSTAAFIARDRRFRDTKRHDLMVPEINIRLGEEYILHLLEEPLIKGDLVRLLAAYNGGPGNLKKWSKQINDGGDTLMLLESLPSRETRFYVKNVMTNLWIYRKRLGQDAQSVASLASGKMAQYTPFAFNGGSNCMLTRLSERCR